MGLLERMLVGVMWTASRIAYSISGVALALSGLEMFRLVDSSAFLLPPLLCFGIDRFASF
jgi:hypothetical protein